MTPTIVDHSHQLYHFFDSYRTPFAILSAVSMTALFQVLSRHRVEGTKGFEKFVTRQCHFAFATPFVSSLILLLVSTITSVTILQGDFDSREVSAFDLIMNNLKCEYVTIQWCCILSILSLIRGLGVLDHDLLHGRKDEFAMALFRIWFNLLCQFKPSTLGQLL